MRLFRHSLFFLIVFISLKGYGQQNTDFYVNGHYLIGKKVLKISRDFYDPFVWILAENNGVYRINSISKEVDDYTSKFSAFNNLQFNCIAGRNKDTVFVGTTSNKVIYFANGALQTIGANEGLNYPVNSIGISFRGQSIPGLVIASKDALQIGTNNGLYSYSIEESRIENFTDFMTGEIYEANYRTLMNSAASAGFYTPEIRSRKVYDLTEYYTTQAFVYEGNYDGMLLGSPVNTANFNNFLGFSNEESGGYTRRKWLFWGSNQGLYAAVLTDSYYLRYPFKHFLDGISVKKLETIYGLTSFGDRSALFSSGVIRQDLLIGTNKGLYFSSSVFADSQWGEDSQTIFHYDPLGSVNINDLCVNHTSDRKDVCENGAWVACDDGVYFLNADFAKFVNGQKLDAAQFEGEYLGKKEKMLCENQILTAEITPSFVNTNSVQWFKDGAQLVGEDHSKLAIAQAGIYHAVLYNPCQNVHIETNTLKVELSPAPVFTSDYPDHIDLCENEAKTLQIAGKPGYNYRWYRDGGLLEETSAKLTVREVGKYRAEVSACPDSWVSAKETEVKIFILPLPGVNADKAAYCLGDEAKLTLNIPASNGYSINWYRDGILQNTLKDKTTIKTAIAGSYTVKVQNPLNCDKTSAALAIAFNPLPTVTITRVVKTTFCEGQTVELQAVFTGGAVKWSTGETAEKITVSRSGTYKTNVTSPAGCEAEAQTSITFFANPVLSVKDTSLCQFNGEIVSLTAPAGYKKYIWNGTEGASSFTVKKLGKVSLTIEDNNGCRASQDILVNGFCADTHIPNAFTPNNDGINDTWAISGIGDDPSLIVQVYNRYGNRVFESKGYHEAWNGRKGTTSLPAGTYYYIITAKNGNQRLSGPVTIIY